MKQARTYIDYIHDIIDAAKDAQEFIAGMDEESFIIDKRTQYAVIHTLNVIGEATKRFPDSLRNRYPEIPWREITGMRDKLSHDYFSINPKRVYETVQRDLPPLCETMNHILADSEEEN